MKNKPKQARPTIKNPPARTRKTPPAVSVPAVPAECRTPEATKRLLTALAENEARIAERLNDRELKDTAAAMLSREARETALAIARVCGVDTDGDSIAAAQPETPADSAPRPGLKLDLSKLPKEQRDEIFLKRNREVAN